MKMRFRKISLLTPKNAAVLDLACGYKGELLSSIEKQIKKGVGVDLVISKKYKISKSKIKLIEGNIEKKLPFKNESFDLVTALAIIEHVDKPEAMLREIKRVLKPNGLILLTTPPLASKPVLELMAKMGLISREEIADHKRYYTKKNLIKTMQEVGFKKVKVKYFGIMWLNLLGKGAV